MIWGRTLSSDKNVVATPLEIMQNIFPTPWFRYEILIIPSFTICFPDRWYVPEVAKPADAKDA